MNVGAANALDLRGNAFERGQAQAALCPDSVPAVRALVATRLASTADLLNQPRIRRYLDAQWDCTGTRDPDGIAELLGIAQGYDLPPKDLFAFLHAGQLAGLPDDGCSAWAFVHPSYGAMVVKNRDLRGPALPLQRLFCHTDPAWGRRRMLCVGSLGAPGAYSSGINTDGLALVDTQVVTTDQGVGLLRYFLMTRLLRHCATVDEAAEMLHDVPHAGGGTLVLGDATGRIAAVELGHSAISVVRDDRGWLARTNHFLSSALAERLLAAPTDPAVDNSQGRLATLTAWLAACDAAPSPAQAAGLMAMHDAGAQTGLCRHGQGGGSSTVSAAIFTCRPGSLYFAHGNPCDAAWVRTACREAKANGLRDEPDR